ncbi:nickel pincer cofactor biosynthesis protein LarC [Actinomarinicola tropica]|uniref:Pyridinium-3,5-bisthiocarboxylic acid mononucleotide nickel insertion protein n=1 Tax=Actinomarinicola tropica TaxID=2789776 RepID=A0A5Q2RMG9_9ACTN|nr:nickel pincer cofactor biosynthesis protein LarC [Actinomarinicola tropica]QGG96664.1 nickel pincer cofactor biosynthesis protein LarC [Actinomarinicola tropica]
MSATRVAWFHCFSGIAGDMALGALIDAGADVDEVRTILDGLDLPGWALDVEPVLRNGIGGTKAHVLQEPTNVVRTASHIAALLDDADLPDRVRRRAHAVFDALAVAEGRLHRQPPEQVHFHEVGAIDAIVDVVGTCAALEVLGIDEVACSPVANGLGTIRAAHGVLPNPAPAVVELLRGAPTVGLDVPVELTTPTGAAIVAALAGEWGPIPDMTIQSAGFGAGTRELDGRPNLVQVVVGDRTETLERGQPVTLLEVNVDDVTGEVLAHAVAALLDAGAHDAWVSPILMKKGRPAHKVSALADPALDAQVAQVMRDETGSFGVRAARLERWPSARSTEVVDLDGDPVRVKVGPGRAKAEFDDAAAIARRTGRPVRDVISHAEAEHHHAHDHPHPHPHPPGPEDTPPA